VVVEDEGVMPRDILVQVGGIGISWSSVGSSDKLEL